MKGDKPGTVSRFPAGRPRQPGSRGAAESPRIKGVGGERGRGPGRRRGLRGCPAAGRGARGAQEPLYERGTAWRARPGPPAPRSPRRALRRGARTGLQAAASGRPRLPGSFLRRPRSPALRVFLISGERGAGSCGPPGGALPAEGAPWWGWVRGHPGSSPCPGRQRSGRPPPGPLHLAAPVRGARQESQVRGLAHTKPRRRLQTALPPAARTPLHPEASPSPGAPSAAPGHSSGGPGHREIVNAFEQAAVGPSLKSRPSGSRHCSPGH
ncbi:collagen alpha-1(I) chain-like [Lepus europaeus]|uniref:collagen alpha-1(I) chain-like n=1 Tax=Lepus europaeus TaxID=9983 RepID=UPI002B49D3D9|nr:collagen alpha-1(I) chain-like [Lepus europaeus]